MQVLDWLRRPTPDCGPAQTSLRFFEIAFVVDRCSGEELSLSTFYSMIYTMNSVLTRTRRKVITELWRQR